jgi:hypothetical protein
MFASDSEPDDKVCQIQSAPRIAEPRDITEEPLPLLKRMKLILKRRLDTRFKKVLKSNFNMIMGQVSRFSSGNRMSTADRMLSSTPLNLRGGDWVRIRPKEEIQSTLDFSAELKGCGFMEDMWSYCGTLHRVLKPVQRFVDERDYKIKRATGVVLLEGLICQGTELYGRCDRACFFFWREEWLEKVKEKNANYGGDMA